MEGFLTGKPLEILGIEVAVNEVEVAKGSIGKTIPSSWDMGLVDDR